MKLAQNDFEMLIEWFWKVNCNGFSKLIEIGFKMLSEIGFKMLSLKCFWKVNWNCFDKFGNFNWMESINEY